MSATAYPVHLTKAIYFAHRSGIRIFSTGAVITSPNGLRVSHGWSHYSQLKLTQYRSIHAELHAILRAPRGLLKGATIYVATIRNKSGNIGHARPCDHCMAILHEVGIKQAFYTVEGREYGRIDIERVS